MRLWVSQCADKSCAHIVYNIYIGAYLIFINNKHLTDKVPQGNGAICQVLGFKLKENAQSYKCKNYYGKKVWTVSATDVEWIECEHVNKTTSLLLQMKSQINELKHQLDLPQNDCQSEKKQSDPSLITSTINWQKN